METLHVTKLRLLREAVQHNVERPRRARRVAVPRPGVAVLTTWLTSACLIASLVYLSLPSGAVSRVRVASAATPAAAGELSGLDDDWSDEPSPSSTEPSPPPPIPRRLDRGVLPLAVKSIV